MASDEQFRKRKFDYDIEEASERRFEDKVVRLTFTGGGTTGHVTKNLIIMEALKKSHPDMVFHYFGSASGKEAELITKDVAQFHAISTGKLRRYFSLQTIPDIFRFFKGIWEAYRLMPKSLHSPLFTKGFEGLGRDDRDGQHERRKQNDSPRRMIFSSGGYVALPVCIAGWLRGIPIMTHETDSVPGLSNRIIGKLATKVLLGYASAARYFNPKKVVITGNPVSPKLFAGSRDRALQKLGFDLKRKTLLVMGGSQGAREINELIWQILPELLKEWQVVHLKGRICKTIRNFRIFKGNPNDPNNPNNLKAPSSYRSFEYVTDDYPDFLSAADLVISRAGGNALAEITALQKPAIIIPLLSAASDHQRKNAEEMTKREPSWLILEKPNAKVLLEKIQLISSLLVLQESSPLPQVLPARGLGLDHGYCRPEYLARLLNQVLNFPTP